MASSMLNYIFIDEIGHTQVVHYLTVAKSYPFQKSFEWDVHFFSLSQFILCCIIGFMCVPCCTARTQKEESIK